MRLTDARFEADITPGASVSFTAASLEADPRKRALECARASAAVNGGVVATAVAVAISVRDVIFGEGGGGAVGVRETFAREEKGAKRRSVDVTATSPRLVLPHGLDLGDAALAAQVGVDAFRHVLAREVSLQKACRDPSPAADGDPRDFEVTLRVVGSLVAEAFDAPLARSLRVKQAVLEPALARARARDAAERLLATSTPRAKENVAAEAATRLRAFVAAAAAAARRAEGAAFATRSPRARRRWRVGRRRLSNGGRTRNAR